VKKPGKLPAVQVSNGLQAWLQSPAGLSATGKKKIGPVKGGSEALQSFRRKQT